MLFHDYRAGHALDLSGNGNDGTLGGADARLCRNGFCNGYYGAGYVSVAHSASINLTTLTVLMLIVGKRITQYQNGTRLFSKGAAGSRAMDVYESPSVSNFTNDVDGGTDCAWASTRGFNGIHCYGFNLSDGVQTPLYLDGLFDVNSSVAPTVGTVVAPLIIGNLSGLSRGFGRTISSFLMFNRLLTADEHRTAYLELLK